MPVNTKNDSVVSVKPVFLPWQKPFLEQLKSLHQRKRLPHAILLSLPGEEDNTGFIWYLSMLLLCRHDENSRPCGECSSCQLMLANTYPDFKLVGLEYDEKNKKINKNIKIEQIRELIHEVHLTRNYDNLKIVVIYPAEKMSIAGANSLLKTIEEPAAHVLVLLVTHHSGRIPVTIRSRCQQWDINFPAQVEALDWLQKQGMQSDESGRYLELAEGDPVLALQLQEINFVDQVGQFKQLFAQYLQNQIDVTNLVQLLKSTDIALTRRLVSMVIKAYCFQFSGLLDGVNANTTPGNKVAAQAMTGLLTQAERQLMIEDNNLDLQLQLEDVLISVKQIIISNR